MARKIWGWEYRTQRDERVREGHSALDGMRLPRAHPLWNRYMPPWDWGCRCFLIPIYEGDWRARVLLPKYAPPTPQDFVLSRMTRGNTRRVTSLNGARMIPARDVVIRSPVKLGFEQSSPGVFRKELIYPGTFIKVDENNQPEFRLIVDEKLMDHWVRTFNQMKKNGIDVPVPIEHSEDPEDRRGTVVDLRKEFNEERGTNSLYVYSTFRKGDEKLAEHSQVSLYAPPEMKDGIGNTYIRPITHVAITDYPLVPGLSRWSPAAAASRARLRKRKAALNRMYDGTSRRSRRAASLADDAKPKDDDEGKETAVDVMDVADAIGITYEDDAKPAEILELIEGTVQELADQVEELGGELPEELADGEVDEFVEEGVEDPAGGDDLEDVTISSEELEEIDAINSGELAAPEEDEEEETPAPASKASRRGNRRSRRPLPASRRRRERQPERRPERRRDVAASRTPANEDASDLIEARKVIIRGLVRDQKITPAAASRLESLYATEGRVVAASRGTKDDFKSVIAALSQNAPAFRTGSRTGAQHQSADAEKTPVVRDAEARASRTSSRK